VRRARRNRIGPHGGEIKRLGTRTPAAVHAVDRVRRLVRQAVPAGLEGRAVVPEHRLAPAAEPAPADGAEGARAGRQAVALEEVLPVVAPLALLGVPGAQVAVVLLGCARGLDHALEPPFDQLGPVPFRAGRHTLAAVPWQAARTPRTLLLVLAARFAGIDAAGARAVPAHAVAPGFVRPVVAVVVAVAPEAGREAVRGDVVRRARSVPAHEHVGCAHVWAEAAPVRADVRHRDAA